MSAREQQLERALREYIATVDGGRQPGEPPQDFNDRGSHAYTQLRLALSTPAAPSGEYATLQARVRELEARREHDLLDARLDGHGDGQESGYRDGYARAIEDAARVADGYAAALVAEAKAALDNGQVRLGHSQIAVLAVAAAIRSLAPAPREDAPSPADRKKERS